MLKIGITGGIGSGKSIVSEILRLYNIPVFDADTEAKKLNDRSPVIREKLIACFGKEVYDENGKLNRKRFAEIIFKDPDHLRKANSIIHPEVAKAFSLWAEQRNQYPIVAIEAALLFEADFQEYVDKVIAVYSPEALRIVRILSRDNTQESEVRKRMEGQLPEDDKRRRADFIVYNDPSHSLLQQISDIFAHLCPPGAF